MSCSIIQLLKNKKLTNEKYVTWKSNLNMILVIDDPPFVLMEECPPSPTRNASRNVRDAYNRWKKVNVKAYVYLLSNMSKIREEGQLRLTSCLEFSCIGHVALLRLKSEMSRL